MVIDLRGLLAVPAQFTTETVDDDDEIRGQICLAVGDGTPPSIAYATVSGIVKLAERTPNGWTVSKVSDVTAARDLYRISLAIDADPKPHIAFVNETNDHLMYGVRAGSWQFEEVPTEAGLFAGAVRFPAMKLYRGDLEIDDVFKWRPHFSYQAGVALKHIAKQPRRDNPSAGPVWKKNFEEVDPFEVTEKGWYSTLDFGKGQQDNTLRIAYFDELAGANRRQLRLATMTQSFDPGVPNTWTVDVVDGGSVVGEFASLEHTISGGGAISYFERKALKLKICIFGPFPESPAVEVVTGNVDNDGVWSSVGISHQFKWCIAYGSGGKLRYATRTGPNTFDIQDVDNGGGWPSMVFDDDGVAHIAHVANGTLRYATAPIGN